MIGGIVESVGAVIMIWGIAWRLLDNKSSQPIYFIVSGLAALLVGAAIDG